MGFEAGGNTRVCSTACYLTPGGLNSWSRQVGQEEAVPARMPAGGKTWGPTSVGDFHWEEILPPLIPAAGGVSGSH